MSRTTFRLSEAMLAAVDAIAADLGCDRSMALRRLLAEAMARRLAGASPATGDLLSEALRLWAAQARDVPPAAHNTAGHGG